MTWNARWRRFAQHHLRDSATHADSCTERCFREVAVYGPHALPLRTLKGRGSTAKARRVQHPIDTDLGFMQRLARAVEKALAAMTWCCGNAIWSVAMWTRAADPKRSARSHRTRDSTEERRQDRRGFIGVLRHIVVRRRKDVASSVATSLRLFQRLSASRIPGGRSWGPPRGLLRSCAVV